MSRFALLFLSVFLAISSWSVAEAKERDLDLGVAVLAPGLTSVKPGTGCEIQTEAAKPVEYAFEDEDGNRASLTLEDKGMIVAPGSTEVTETGACVFRGQVTLDTTMDYTFFAGPTELLTLSADDISGLENGLMIGVSFMQRRVSATDTPFADESVDDVLAGTSSSGSRTTRRPTPTPRPSNDDNDWNCDDVANWQDEVEDARPARNEWIDMFLDGDIDVEELSEDDALLLADGLDEWADELEEFDPADIPDAARDLHKATISYLREHATAFRAVSDEGPDVYADYEDTLEQVTRRRSRAERVMEKRCPGTTSAPVHQAVTSASSGMKNAVVNSRNRA